MGELLVWCIGAWWHPRCTGALGWMWWSDAPAGGTRSLSTIPIGPCSNPTRTSVPLTGAFAAVGGTLIRSPQCSSVIGHFPTTCLSHASSSTSPYNRNLNKHLVSLRRPHSRCSPWHRETVLFRRAQAPYDCPSSHNSAKLDSHQELLQGLFLPTNKNRVQSTCVCPTQLLAIFFWPPFYFCGKRAPSARGLMVSESVSVQRVSLKRGLPPEIDLLFIEISEEKTLTFPDLITVLCMRECNGCGAWKAVDCTRQLFVPLTSTHT